MGDQWKRKTRRADIEAAQRAVFWVEKEDRILLLQGSTNVGS